MLAYNRIVLSHHRLESRRTHVESHGGWMPLSLNWMWTGWLIPPFLTEGINIKPVNSLRQKNITALLVGTNRTSQYTVRSDTSSRGLSCHLRLKYLYVTWRDGTFFFVDVHLLKWKNLGNRQGYRRRVTRIDIQTQKRQIVCACIFGWPTVENRAIHWPHRPYWHILRDARPPGETPSLNCLRPRT